MRQFIKKEQGNALILGAVSFAVLTAFGVLTIDIGRILVTRTQLQNAADAGALAGASLFCSQGDPTDAEIQTMVRAVGGEHMTLAMDAPEKVSIPNSQIFIRRNAETGSNEVEVHTNSDTRQYFMNLMSGQNWAGAKRGTFDNVEAEAVAACGATCGVTCVKPWSIPDRWDDNVTIPGYGPGSKKDNWKNNDRWDGEKITNDVNGNGLYDPGDSYEDGNGDGQYNQEPYNPLLTGYIPDPYPGNYLAPSGDLGLELTLKAGLPATAPAPGQYWPVDLPPLNRGTPITGGDQYRDNIAACNAAQVWPGDWLQTESGNMVGPTNQGMRDLIAQDPDAYWDPVTQSVQGSHFQTSPRIVLIPIHDPRMFITSGNSKVQVTKVAAFFMEQMEGNSEVRGRFLKVRNPGTPCTAGGGGGGGAVSFTYQLSLIR